MTSTQILAEFARLASEATPRDDAMRKAMPLLAACLDAHELLVVDGNDAGFQRVGAHPDFGLSDAALWLISRELSARGAPCAFDLEGAEVTGFRDARQEDLCQHVAARLPTPANGVALVIARGSWPTGLGAERAETLEAALPSLALLLEGRLDLRRRERQRSQLSALANIARVISREQDLERVLTSIASSIAMAANMDFVTIDVVDGSGRPQARAMGTLHPNEDGLQERYLATAKHPAPVRDAVLMTRSPMTFTNAQEDERIPEETRGLFAKKRIQSCAMFPLVTGDDVLGTLGMATHRRLDFERRGVDALVALVAQVAIAIKGLRLYQEVNRSREELQRLNQQLQESMGIEHHLARTDSLTGIPNRRFIDETIAMELSRADRYGQDLAIVMADLDDLKGINDGYGHEAGDGILRFVAEIARRSCRQVDVVGRYGGDEFVFVLPATRADEALLFAERFRQQLAAKPAPVPARESLHLTVSLGVACWDSESPADPATLIRQADRAMYKAKSTGRNRTVVADAEAMHAA